MSFNLDSLLNEVSRGFSGIERQYGGKKAKEPPELTVHEFDNPDPVAPSALASINDAFRRAESDASIPGMKILSPALEEHGDATASGIHSLVGEYRDFDPDDREHAFGLVVHKSAGEVVWQIDYFADENCEETATDPEDTHRSYRVLSIFSASEVESS